MQGIIAWTIIIMLIIPFALWGINKYFDGGGPLVAAIVNGEDISVQSYQQAYNNQRGRMREMLGAKYDPAVYDDIAKKQAIDDLVQREILFQNASDMGMRVSADTVVQTIQSIDEFKADGKFSNELYTRILQSQGESPFGFENRVQHSILTQQLYSAIASSALVTEQEVNTALNLLEQKRSIQYLTLPAANYNDASVASEQSIQSYYDAHKETYMTPEKVSIEYVELNVADLASDKQPTDEELHQFYDERKSQFAVAEERRTRHILIAVEEGADKAKVEAARKKADEIKARIDKGEKFEDLAKEFSDDPGSSKLGGDLGYFGRGFMEPAFEDAMFSMKVGEVSEPVLTSFGFHIIKLEDIRSEKSKSFEEVKSDLIRDYQRGIAEREFFARSEKLTNLAYEVPDSLNDAAGAVNIPIKTSELFDRNGGAAGITKNPKVITAAFSDEVLKQKYNSEPIEIGENHVVVLRVKDHVERQQQALEQVKEAIRQQLINDAAREKAKTAGEAFVKRLAAGEDAGAIAKEAKLEWKTADGLKRTDRSIDGDIVSKTFKMTKPLEGKPVHAGVELTNGDYAIISLAKVESGSTQKTDDAQKVSLKRNLASMQGQTDFGNLLTTLKQNSQIKINQDNL